MCGALFTVRREKSVQKLAINSKALLFLSAFTAMFFHTSFARAEVQGNVILAAVSTKQPVLSKSYPKLFGKKERHYSDISAFTKWSDMFERFQDEVKVSSNSKKMKKWGKKLQSLKEKSTREKIVAVNDYMNSVKFVSDTKNWKKRDYWATPLEFMREGGDCEDYAIAKYVSLRALGIPGNQMRIAIVQDQVLRVPHAVLVVYDGKEALILDNQNDEVIASSDIDRYTPIYSISQTAWWRH